MGAEICRHRVHCSWCKTHPIWRAAVGAPAVCPEGESPAIAPAPARQAAWLADRLAACTACRAAGRSDCFLAHATPCFLKAKLREQSTTCPAGFF